MKRIQLLYCQKRCLNYAGVPATVAYEEEPTAAKRLLASGGDYEGGWLRSSNSGAPQQIAEFIPSCLTGFEGSIPLATNTCSGWGGDIGASGAVIFMHERVSPAGHRQLVVMRYPDDFFSEFDYVVARPVVFGSPNPGYMHLAYQCTPLNIAVSHQRKAANLRMYEGQIDPADASHFTIRYEAWGQTDTLDGWLLDDGTVSLKSRLATKSTP